jgi:hypothetical protein
MQGEKGGFKMTKEDLQKFCSTDSTRVNINKPFSDGDYTYATNGCIIVRVTRIEGVGEQEVFDTLKKIDAGKLFSNIPNYPYFTIPDIPEPSFDTCHKCAGTGKTKTCPECGGDGVVMLSNRYNHYECDCETCGGDGYYAKGKGEETTCEQCGGEGKIYKRENSIASGRLYRNIYLSLLKELPECLLAEAKDLEPGHFKFTGGDGMLMPLKV